MTTPIQFENPLDAIKSLGISVEQALFLPVVDFVVKRPVSADNYVNRRLNHNNHRLNVSFSGEHAQALLNTGYFPVDEKHLFGPSSVDPKTGLPWGGYPEYHFGVPGRFGTYFMVYETEEGWFVTY